MTLCFLLEGAAIEVATTHSKERERERYIHEHIGFVCTSQVLELHDKPTKLEKKAFSKPFKNRQAHRPANRRTKREAVGEVSGNVTKKQKRRVSKVSWGFSAW